MTFPVSIEQKLADALAECDKLREENRHLRERLGLAQVEPVTPPVSSQPIPLASATVTAQSCSEDKVKLFRSLFRGREDVYAVRWEGRNGKTGYSPACRRGWGGPFRKKSDEPKEYFPLTDQVIQNHLTGKQRRAIAEQLAAIPNQRIGPHCITMIG